MAKIKFTSLGQFYVSTTTMQISEEMEKGQREATKRIVEEPEDPFRDDYFVHLEGGLNINLDRVASNEEKSHSSEEDNEALNKMYIIETLDQELE